MKNHNIDPNEIAKFSSANWWDPESEFKPLHDINPLRLGYIDQKAGLAGKTVLDMGCGGGILAEGMAKLGANVTGIDMSETALNAAKLHLHESGVQVNYLLMTAEEMAITHAGQFDVVTCLEMLEHVPDPVSIINACAKLVKPGGDLFFSTLNRNMKSYLFAIIGAEYILKMLPQNTHDFAKFIRPSELANWARQANLSICDLKGITYQVFTRQYRLSEDISVNYIGHMKRDKSSSI